MAFKTEKGEFFPKNPKKYDGKTPIIYRSSWERRMMETLDAHPSVLVWQSETIQIPYQNPLTGKWTVYIPDFLVAYADKTGKKHVDMIEIKPLKEVPGYRKVNEATGKSRVSQKDKLAQAVNMAKWTAARIFCAKRGINFRVATEADLFAYKRSQ